ncbi:MAG TPA: S8 family serine peptidase, partial [Pyrinomonadaceae bacterium]|nr:S8 family serine peptidase [Pyrinomonadaceae bacterium]
APARAAYATPARAGELLVRFHEGVAESVKGAAVSTRGGRIKGKLRGESRVEKVEARPGTEPSVLAESLRVDPSVEFAEPNFLVTRAQVAPSDERFAEQWALRNTGQAGGEVGADVRAPVAWQETTGSASTVVSVIDSGVDFTHPDLAGQQWRNAGERGANGRDDDGNGLADDLHGWDWVTDSGVVRDGQGHGTAVAGLVAAEGNNGEGVAGVMWRASLMSLRVLDSSGVGDMASAVEAIDYAAAHGAHVVNLSWGTEGESRALRDAIERAGRRGVVVVASAGNGARDLDAAPYYPASFDLPNLISVASTDGFDRLAAFSNHGGRSVAVGAPGVDLLTTKMGGGYFHVSGTSASAPLVAGIAGLLKTLRPNASAAAVREAVVSGARQAASLEGSVASGGVADAAGAVGALRGNPYGGAGNGNGGGNGQGNNRPYVPPALRRENEEARGRDRKGLTAAPPPEVRGALGPNLPDLAASRRRRTSPEVVSPPAPIQSNLMCADCDPWGGGGAGGSDPYFATARTRPENSTGAEGETLGSRNFNWALPLVHLPGRAGLDLSLALHYNSLVWTKQGTSVQYNADHGTPAPGFQLGLPRLQSPYTDLDSGATSYVMITPSGGRVELRRAGESNTFDDASGSGTQLVRYYDIRARHSGKCLEVSGASQSNGGGAQQVTCTGAAGQQWQLVPTGDGYYQIVARHSGKALDVAGNSPDNGAGVHQWSYVGGANQQWQLAPTGDGYYRLVARHSGKVADVAWASSADGAGVLQWEANGGWNQQWALAPAPGASLVVRTTDGTQYWFGLQAGGEWRCTRVQDRNGNYLSATYDPNNGHLQSVADTLGRVVQFTYNDDGNLHKITQSWGGTTHVYATFAYASKAVSPNFSGLSVVGPQNGAAQTVLSSVTLSDNHSFHFDYNDYGQVFRVTRKAPDGHDLVRTTYTFNLSGAQTDCPRFTERRDWAEDWNNGQDSVTQFAVTQNASWTNPETGAQE